MRLRKAPLPYVVDQRTENVQERFFLLLHAIKMLTDFSQIFKSLRYLVKSQNNQLAILFYGLHLSVLKGDHELSLLSWLHLVELLALHIVFEQGALDSFLLNSDLLSKAVNCARQFAERDTDFAIKNLESPHCVLVLSTGSSSHSIHRILGLLLNLGVVQHFLLQLLNRKQAQSELCLVHSKRLRAND